MEALDRVPPADSAQRRRLVDGVDDSFFVDAAAGSGKTTALIDRIVNQLAAGMEPSRVVAITFTTAAAAEMRDRLRARLGQLARVGPWASDVLRCFDDLTISTIHAFLLRLLTAHSISVGLPARLQLLADDSEAQEIERLERDIRSSLYDNISHEPLVRRAFALGFSDRRVHDIVVDLADSWHLFSSSPESVGDLAAIEIEGLMMAANRFVACNSVGVPDSDAAVKMQATVRAWLGEAIHAFDDESRCRLVVRIDDVFQSAKGNPRSKEWGADRKADVQDAVDDLRASAIATADTVRGEVETRLLECVGAVLVQGAARRQAQGVLTRHDLLVHGTRLVTEQQDLAAEVARGIGSLFVDEFQDTDPHQAEFVAALNRAGTGMLLFTVGDPMQSIYRFRGADVHAFDDARHELAHEPVRLEVNFRSSPRIISLVNGIVPALAHDSSRDLYSGLVAYRSVNESRVIHLDGVHASRVLARNAEASQIAALIQEMRADGSLDRLSDCAILLPKRTGLQAIVDALDRHDIPIRIESRELLHRTADVINLLTVLGAIAQPNDKIHVVGALRTPLLGCSDAELARYVRRGGSWLVPVFDASSNFTDDPVGAKLSWVSEMHELHKTVDASAMVKRVIADTRVEELAFASRRPRDVLRRIDFVLDQARAYCDGGGAGMDGFLRSMNSQAAANMSQNDRVVPEFDDDAVRFMTVHAAKGLEFKTAIVAGFSDSRAPSSPLALRYPRGHNGLATQFTGVTTQFREAADRHKSLENEEMVRLLYVALTRAQDHLIVSTHRALVKSTANESIASRLVKVIANNATVEIETWAPDSPSEHEPPLIHHRVERNFIDHDPVMWGSSRAARLVTQTARTSVSATSLSQTATVDADEVQSSFEGSTRRRGGGNGTQVGRAVHSVMQIVSLGLPASGGPENDSDPTQEIVAAARAEADVEGIPERTSDVIRIVTSCLASPTLIAAAHSPAVHREVFVAATIDAVVVEGFIDLLYQDPLGQWVLVDYKTDAITSAAQRDDRMAKYRLQGATYALVLERAAGIKVARCVFVFADAPVALREVEVVDLELAVAEVVSRLSASSEVTHSVS